ncbi:hypothetical protein PAPHI01_0482 [Pancytospora philotis]|nr:hypothetical protein PAPHI01_0482 [Pancytospora philotis]
MRYKPAADQSMIMIYRYLYFHPAEPRKICASEFGDECCDFSILLPYVIAVGEDDFTPVVSFGALYALLAVAYTRIDFRIPNAVAYICSNCMIRARNYDKMLHHAKGKVLHEITKQAMRDDPAVLAEIVIGPKVKTEERACELLTATTLNCGKRFLVFIPATKLPNHLMMLRDVFIHEMIPREEDDADGELQLSGNYMPLINFSTPLDFELIFTAQVDDLPQNLRIGNSRFHAKSGKVVSMDELIKNRNRIVEHREYYFCPKFTYLDGDLPVTVLENIGKSMSIHKTGFYAISKHWQKGPVIDVLERKTEHVNKNESEKSIESVQNKTLEEGAKDVQKEKPVQHDSSITLSTGYWSSPLNQHAPSDDCGGPTKEERHSQQPSAKPKKGSRLLRALLLSISITGIIAIIAICLVNKLF